MKRIFSVSILLLQLAAAPSAFSTGTETHGADPLIEIIRSGRNKAAQALRAMSSDFLINHDAQGLWLLARRSELLDEIGSSEFQYTEDALPTGTCAGTQAEKGQPIRFSLPACRLADLNDKKAAVLLAHEGAHHLGVIDESFAYSIGRILETYFLYSDAAPYDSGPLHAAIVYSPSSGKYGSSWNASSDSGAINSSLMMCVRSDCRRAAVSTNGCVAVFFVPLEPSVFGAASASTRSEAEALAHSRCGADNCELRASVCNLRARR